MIYVLRAAHSHDLGQFARRQALTSEPYSGLRPGRIGRETMADTRPPPDGSGIHLSRDTKITKPETPRLLRRQVLPRLPSGSWLLGYVFISARSAALPPSGECFPA